LAAKLKKRFITIDSDAYFLRAVNIGPTGRWGWPLLYRNSRATRRARFSRYSDFSVDSFPEFSLPDLILIDGRFRVACALKTIRALKDQRNWTIVVDDYVSRKTYETIERFGRRNRGLC
jgi:hypothetical protein